MAYQPLTSLNAPNTATNISSAADELLQRRIGGYSPALQARFRSMDEATAGAAGTNRASAMGSAARASGVFGPGLRRAGQAADEKNLAAVAAGQLQQAQLAGEDQNQAMTAGIARGAQNRQEQFANLQAANTNAANIGDTTTQAALQDVYMGNAGRSYTDVGRERMAADAKAAADEAAWTRAQQDKYQADAVGGESGPWWKRTLKGAAGGGMAGSAAGPWGAAGGAVVGGLAGLFA